MTGTKVVLSPVPVLVLLPTESDEKVLALLHLVGDITREKGLAGEAPVREEFMIGTKVVLSPVLVLVLLPRESDEQALVLLLHLLVGVSGQPQQDLPCQSVIRARVEIKTKLFESNFLVGLMRCSYITGDVDSVVQCNPSNRTKL